MSTSIFAAWKFDNLGFWLCKYGIEVRLISHSWGTGSIAKSKSAGIFTSFFDILDNNKIY